MDIEVERVFLGQYSIEHARSEFPGLGLTYERGYWEGCTRASCQHVGHDPRTPGVWISGPTGAAHVPQDMAHEVDTIAGILLRDGLVLVQFPLNMPPSTYVPCFRLLRAVDHHEVHDDDTVTQAGVYEAEDFLI